jgi:hypothetical protein
LKFTLRRTLPRFWSLFTKVIAASHPSLVATPSWCGDKYEFTILRLSKQASFEVNLRKQFPIAIGLIPPSYEEQIKTHHIINDKFLKEVGQTIKNCTLLLKLLVPADLVHPLIKI